MIWSSKNPLARLLGRTIQKIVPAKGLNRLQSIIAAHDYTILADPNHLDAVFLDRFLASDIFVERALKAGVTSLALEENCLFQSQADDVAKHPDDAGRKKDFLETIYRNTFSICNDSKLSHFLQSALVVQLVSLYAPCAKVIFADQKHVSFVGNIILCSRGLDEIEEDRANNLISAEEAETLTAECARKLEYAVKKLHEERTSRQCNEEIIDRIERESPADGRRLIVFGAGHAEIMKQILQERGHTVAVVGLHATQNAYELNTQMEAVPELGFVIDELRFNDEPFTMVHKKIGPRPRKIELTAQNYRS